MVDNHIVLVLFIDPRINLHTPFPQIQRVCVHLKIPLVHCPSYNSSLKSGMCFIISMCMFNTLIDGKILCKT